MAHLYNSTLLVRVSISRALHRFFCSLFITCSGADSKTRYYRVQDPIQFPKMLTGISVVPVSLELGHCDSDEIYQKLEFMLEETQKERITFAEPRKANQTNWRAPADC